MKGGCPEPECRRWWVSTRTYTAECLNGRTGSAVTVTRQARSYISQQDADEKAARLAKCEAIAELRCYFQASQSWLTACSAVQPPQLITRTAESTISYEDAVAKALADARQTAENLCEFGFEGGGLPLALVEGGLLRLMGGGKLISTL